MSETWDETSIRVQALQLAILSIEKGANFEALGLFEMAKKIYDFLTGTFSE